MPFTFTKKDFVVVFAGLINALVFAAFLLIIVDYPVAMESFSKAFMGVGWTTTMMASFFATYLVCHKLMLSDGGNDDQGNHSA